MRKPTEEDIRNGWTQNSRGGWQPPDSELDIVDIPELSPDARTIHRGSFEEYLKLRRE
jgi:hypothetical protein